MIIAAYKHSISHRFLSMLVLPCLALLLFVPALRAAPQDQYEVSAVVISGNKRIDSAALRIQIKASPGVVARSTVSEDIKALYRTGFFDSVTASVSAQQGSTLLRYELIEKPVVRKIYIKGNKEVSEKDLAEIFNLEGRRFLDKAKLQQMMRAAVAYYQGRGFYDASFEQSVVAVGEGAVDVTFTVVEGDRYKIAEIEFRGLTQIDESDLREVMQTKHYKWWNSWLMGTGRLNKEMLENDKALLRQYFLNNGYVDASIGEAEIEKRDGELWIVFDVQEGRQYTIGTVSAVGDLIESSESKTLESIKSEVGEVFSAEGIREDSFLISDKFSDLGYAFANVVPGTELDRESAKVNLQFQVDKGRQVSIDRINIRGNNKTYDHVIRRELKVIEQEVFSGAKVKRSQALLQRLGYFEEATITTEPSKDPNLVDLNVNVREGSTGSFSAGAGFSSSDGALFNARLAEENILGTGRRANINFDFGTERENLIFSLEDRRVADTYMSLGLDLLRTKREFSDFDRDLSGAALTAGYPLEEIFGEALQDIGVSLKYEYLDIYIDEVDLEDAAQLVIDSEGPSSSSGVTPRITRNTIDNPLNPSSGSRQTAGLEVTGLGGSEEYWLLDVRQQVYYPLIDTSAGKIVGAWRTSFGYGDTFDGDTFPLFRRYFPGGINSVRGFKNRSLGPKDANGNEYGGSKELVNNLEIIFPIISSAGLRGVVFYDIGEAFDDDKSIALGELRHAYGAGIRWNSPLGPIRVEFGFPIDREDGEDAMVTLFSFGAPL
jgi:outer membrane protein insertion porin family